MAARARNRFAVAPRPRLRDRVLTCLEARKLDDALAGGTPPEANARLALRARRLTRLNHRRAMATAIDALARGGQSSTQLARLRIRPLRGRVTAADAELGRLAERLAQPGPVAARGVAQAQLLLTDGTGALYNPARSTSVSTLAANATANLELHDLRVRDQ